MEEADCRAQCGAELQGNGLRRKREVPRGKTEGWEENMELKVSPHFCFC